jgi:hypothetical protein
MQHENSVFGRSFDTILCDLDDALYQIEEIPATVRHNIEGESCGLFSLPAVVNRLEPPNL